MALCNGVPAVAQDANISAAVKAKPTVALPSRQMREIKGTVIDMGTRQPVTGVSVQALGDNRYIAMTNTKGEFTIKVPVTETTLYVHTPKYISQKIAIDKKGGKEITVKLINDHFNPMFEDGTNITASPKVTMYNTTGLTAEVQIGEQLGADMRTVSRNGGPGYGAVQFIRGLHSLNSNSMPLVVIDGIVQDMQYTREAIHDGDYVNFWLNIIPEDIDQVQVLKNGTAIYGAKGSNGVILISTKRGHSMATRIDANIGAGVNLVPKLPEMMNATSYRLYAAEMLGTYPNIDNFTGNFKFLSDDKSKFYYNTYHNDTDWSKEAYHTTVTQNYNINVQGGDNIGMYNLSLGYTDAQSTARENGFNRLAVRFNNDLKILRGLSTRFDLSFSKTNRNVFDNGAPEDFTVGPVASPTFLSLIKAPILSPYTYNTTTHKLSSTLSGPDDFLTELDKELTLGNPTALLDNGSRIDKNRVEMTHFNAVITPKYNFNKYLSLSETFCYAYDYVSQRYYRPLGGMPSFTIPDIGRVENMAMAFSAKENSIQSDTRLEFKKVMGQSTIAAFGGLRFNSFSYDQNAPKGQYSSGGNDKTPNISTDMDFQSASGVNDQWRSFTWYANADYSYRNTYFLQLSLAMESNSRFGENASGALKLAGVRWGLFPSVQAGWALTSESWFPKADALNYLLLHTGYDISGNDGISNYAARTSFNLVKYLNTSNGIQLNNIGNDGIKWEQTGKFDIGIKSSWLNNRIGLDFDYFYDHTSNLLTIKDIDNPVLGVNSYLSNGGSLDNTGFEATLMGKPVVGRNLNVELGASVGHYSNKVKSLPDNKVVYIDGKPSGSGFLSSAYGTENIATIVGKPIGMFYGYKTSGVFASDEAAREAGNGGYLYMTDTKGAHQDFRAGDMHFQDLNGDGEISDADKTIIGNPNPDIYGNIFAKVNWKNFTLSAIFNYSFGNDVFNYERQLLESGRNFYNQTTSIEKRWRGEGQITSVPKLAYGDPMGNSRFSDRWIEDGSYLRLKTLNLTYEVPVNFSWLQRLSIWAEATNLFTLTHYLGSDPEFSAANSVLYQGIDAGNVALGRSFTLGLRINL